MSNLTIPGMINQTLPIDPRLRQRLFFAPVPAMVLKLYQQSIAIGNTHVSVWFVPTGYTAQTAPLDSKIIGQNLEGVFYARVENW